MEKMNEENKEKVKEEVKEEEKVEKKEVKKEEKNYFLGILISLLTGLFLGFIILILFAPKPGKEIRKDIKDKFLFSIVNNSNKIVLIDKLKQLDN